MSNFNFSALTVANDDKLANYRKEKGFYKSLVLVVLDGGAIRDYAEIRFYRTAARNYACFWISNPVLGHGQTGGMAGGYGYDRAEAALSEAARKHGITGEWFDARKLLEALAQHIGAEVYSVIESHA